MLGVACGRTRCRWRPRRGLHQPQASVQHPRRRTPARQRVDAFCTCRPVLTYSKCISWSSTIACCECWQAVGNPRLEIQGEWIAVRHEHHTPSPAAKAGCQLIALCCKLVSCSAGRFLTLPQRCAVHCSAQQGHARSPQCDSSEPAAAARAPSAQGRQSPLLGLGRCPPRLRVWMLNQHKLASSR